MQSPVSTFVARSVVGQVLRRPWPILAVVCCLIANVAAAQSALTGIVHDPSLRVAVDATITVTDASSTQEWVTHTSVIGYYEIELPPGVYQIRAELNQQAFTLTYKGTVRVFP